MARDRDDDSNGPEPAAEASADPDADIVDLFRAGEHNEALRKLMARHGNAVYRFVWAGLHDETRAEDVHQKVFIAAFNDLPRFGGRSTVKTWLFSIARHRMLDDLKSHKRAQQRVVLDDGVDVEDSAEPLDDRIDENRLYAALTACVGELPEDSRAAVLLRFVSGFSFEQMAEICDEKPGTLQARVARAMAKLRKCIAAGSGT